MDGSQPLAVRRQVLAGRVAYLEGEIAELERQMALVKRDVTVRTWELGEALIEQAELERHGAFNPKAEEPAEVSGGGGADADADASAGS